jgi:ribokinase
VKRPRIVVVGSANTDMVVKAARIPAPGETVLGGAFVMAAGGKGANQAVAAARLGAEVTFVARLGADPLGDEAIAGYSSDGILTDLVVRDPRRPTGVALILVDARGENSITVALGANEALSPDDVDRAADRIRAADAVVAQLEVPLAAVERAAAIAAAAGVPLILDPAPAPDGGLPPALLRHVTCLKPNASEAERLTGIPVTDAATAAEAAAALRRLGPRIVIVTLGGDGAILVDAAGARHVAAPCVAAVDTTAAGDAFTGALATAVGQGLGWDEAVRRAAAAGALAATRMGAQPSLPTQAEWEDFLAAWHAPQTGRTKT